MPRKWDLDDLPEAVENAKSLTGVLRNLGLAAYGGGNHDTVRKYIEKLDIDTSHFDVDQIRLDALDGDRIDDSEIFVKDSKVSTNTVRRRAREKFDQICDICENDGEWLGKELTLHLDHINGDTTDNRKENLRFLCPNCHSQTETYAGKSLNRNKCKDCESEISRGATRCRSCATKNFRDTKIDWPKTKWLKQMVEEYSYVAVSRRLGVSDNAVRKRIKNH